jgi:hypothetical protein
MTHDAPMRRVNGRSESLRWQPTRGRRERKLHSAFRSGRPVAVARNGQAASGEGRTPRRQRVRAQAIAGMLLGGTGPRNIARLELQGARITGSLDLSYARIDYPITLRDCVFDGPIVLAEARLGALTLDRCRFRGLDGRNLEVDGDLVLSRVSSSGTVWLTGAHLHRDLMLEGAHLGCGEDEEATLAADHLVVDGSITCAGVTASGTVSMANAQVNGAVRLDNATITADGAQPRAFDGDGMAVGHELLAHKLTATGEVTLVGARVAGALELRGAELANPGGVALLLDRAEISGSLYCDDGFKAAGALRATGAHVKGTVYLNGAELGGPPRACGAAGPARAEPALSLIRTRIDGDLGCWARFAAHGTVELTDSSVGGEFSLRTTELNGRPTAAELAHSRFATLTLGGEPPTGFVDLTKAKTDFFDDTAVARWTEGNIVLDEFEYGAIALLAVTVKQREEWLRRAMEASARKTGGAHDGYLPQPYDQLAAAYRRAGDDHSARRIQLAKYRQRNKVTGWRRWYSKLWNIVQDVVIGYGYEPRRALIWLLGLFVVWVVLFRYVPAVRPYAIISVHQHTPRFSLYNSVGYTLDLLLPTSALEERQVWQSNGLGEVAASSLVIFGWLLTATVFAAAARVLQRG